MESRNWDAGLDIVTTQKGIKFSATRRKDVASASISTPVGAHRGGSSFAQKRKKSTDNRKETLQIVGREGFETA